MAVLLREDSNAVANTSHILLSTAYTDTLLYVSNIVCQFLPLFQCYSRAKRKLLTLLDV